MRDVALAYSRTCPGPIWEGEHEDVNGEPLSYGHGAQLLLRNEIQLGFKQVKWLAGIDFVAHFTEVGGGYGGYNPDHELSGYRQSI